MGDKPECAIPDDNRDMHPESSENDIDKKEHVVDARQCYGKTGVVKTFEMCMG
jgi:hypothetical protein